MNSNKKPSANRAGRGGRKNYKTGGYAHSSPGRTNSTSLGGVAWSECNCTTGSCGDICVNAKCSCECTDGSYNGNVGDDPYGCLSWEGVIYTCDQNKCASQCQTFCKNQTRRRKPNTSYRSGGRINKKKKLRGGRVGRGMKRGGRIRRR